MRARRLIIFAVTATFFACEHNANAMPEAQCKKALSIIEMLDADTERSISYLAKYDIRAGIMLMPNLDQKYDMATLFRATEAATNSLKETRKAAEKVKQDLIACPQ